MRSLALLSALFFIFHVTSNEKCWGRALSLDTRTVLTPEETKVEVVAPLEGKSEPASSESNNELTVPIAAEVDGNNPAPGSKTQCVCQFQAAPDNCSSKKKKDECLKFDGDCIWVIRTNPRGIDVCKNWHQHHCDLEFHRNNNQVSCDTITTISSKEPLPEPSEGFDKYYYSYIGHGGRSEELYKTAEWLIEASNRENRDSKITVFDQACLSFSSQNLWGSKSIGNVRKDIKEKLMSKIEGNQTVTLMANQVEATGDTEAPYENQNPYYLFQFDKTRILHEQPVPCSQPEPTYCEEGAKFLCKTDNGVTSKICCDSKWLQGEVFCPGKAGEKPDFTHKEQFLIVLRLFLGALDRVPDDEGYKLSFDLQRPGLGDLAKIVAYSQEFKDHNGSKTPREVLQNLYRTLLKRDLDYVGEVGWLNQLKEKKTDWAGVIEGILRSPEFEQKVTDQNYY